MAFHPCFFFTISSVFFFVLLIWEKCRFFSTNIPVTIDGLIRKVNPYAWFRAPTFQTWFWKSLSLCHSPSLLMCFFFLRVFLLGPHFKLYLYLPWNYCAISILAFALISLEHFYLVLNVNVTLFCKTGTFYEAQHIKLAREMHTQWQKKILYLLTW